MGASERLGQVSHALAETSVPIRRPSQHKLTIAINRDVKDEITPDSGAHDGFSTDDLARETGGATRAMTDGANRSRFGHTDLFSRPQTGPVSCCA